MQKKKEKVKVQMIQKDFFFEKWAHMNVREKFLEVTNLDNRNSSIFAKT